MGQILLLRHSESEANARGLMAGGLSNTRLTAHGKEIAREKGAALRKTALMPTYVYCSTLRRTTETAAIILKELGAETEIQVLTSLVERKFGAYDGKEYDRLMEAFDEYGPNPPTVEKTDDFVKRVLAGFDEVKKAATSGTVLVVTHSNVLAVLHSALYEPERLHEFWEAYHADLCEGFSVLV